MKQKLLSLSLFIFLIFIIIIPSGCLQEYGELRITNVDAMAVPQDDGNKLTVTTYIQNTQDVDSGVLSIKVKIRDPSTNLIVAEKDSDIGYIKSSSSSSNTISLIVSGTGNFQIEVNLLEEGMLLDQYGDTVTVKAQPGPGEPAQIKLTDMNLKIVQFVDGASKVVIDISPGIYNQGGDSRPLVMEVTARVNPYTAYTESDELGIIKQSSSVRGNVRFILPQKGEYTFTASIMEGGKTVVSGNVDHVIKLNDIRWNTLMTYPFVEEDVPVESPSEEQPGFQAVFALIGILLVYNIIHRNKGKK